jgi:hypothetical protein
VNHAEFRKQAKTVIEETRAAREALEAKGAFTEANAATHVIRALEALIKVLDLGAVL